MKLEKFSGLPKLKKVSRFNILLPRVFVEGKRRKKKKEKKPLIKIRFHFMFNVASEKLL